MKYVSVIKILLNIFVILLLGISVLVFSFLYLNTFLYGFFYNNKEILMYFITACVCIVGILAVIFSITDNTFIYKFTIITLGFLAIVLSLLYLLKVTGVLDKIDNIEDLRNYVASFGYLAVYMYIVMNVLQVVILPIPGFIAVATGVALFGAFKTSIYSLIGILIGSLIAFFIGRVLGYKIVSWLVGENTLKKWTNSIKNKDKIILTFMFLFPLFPDDVLCFVAGLSTMSTTYFIVMIVICRIISVVFSAYSINGSLIPYNTWWGITIWIIISIFTVLFSVYLYRNGDKIEKYIKRKLKKR